LTPAQTTLLDKFYLKLNYNGHYHDYPIVHDNAGSAFSAY
jgi:hypothetical protein